jgi:hypothetical protein
VERGGRTKPWGATPNGGIAVPHSAEADQAANENNSDDQNSGVMSPEQRTKCDALQAEHDTLKIEKAALEEEAKKRQARGNLTTEDFARKAGVTEEATRKYFRGTDVPRLDCWPRIGRALVLKKSREPVLMV